MFGSIPPTPRDGHCSVREKASPGIPRIEETGEGYYKRHYWYEKKNIWNVVKRGMDV